MSKVFIFCEGVERGVSQFESSLDKTHVSVLRHPVRRERVDFVAEFINFSILTVFSSFGYSVSASRSQQTLICLLDTTFSCVMAEEQWDNSTKYRYNAPNFHRVFKFLKVSSLLVVY